MSEFTTPEISIGITNALMPIETHASYGIKAWRELQQKIQVDRGMEFHPVRGRLFVEMAGAAFIGAFHNEADGQPLISSLHQSFMGKDGLSLSQKAKSLLLPPAPDSLKTLEHVSNWVDLGTPMLTNVYPDTLQPGEVYDTDIFHPIAQLYPAIWRGEPAEVYRRLAMQGVKGFCGDTAHARDASDPESTMPSWEVLWPEVTASGRMSALHVAIGRLDLQRRSPELAAKSMGEYTAFTQGSPKAAKATEIADMFAAVKEAMPAEQIVMPATLEVAPEVIGRDALSTAIVLGRLVENTRAVWADA